MLALELRLRATRIGERFVLGGIVGTSCALGAIQLWPGTQPIEQAPLPTLEAEALIERDLARWIAPRTAGPSSAIVWAPPNITSTLHYYGALRGIGTLSPDNAEGLAAAYRIASAASMDEAGALIRARGITHIVLPSWEPFFPNVPAQLAPGTAVNFAVALQQWSLPSWLKPLAYQFPPIAGLENYAVAVLEVVDEQEPALALARLAEYFAEMGQLDRAAAAAKSLERFPADLGALAARAQVAGALNDSGNQARAIESLRSLLNSRNRRPLAWDRRVSLALVLARAQEFELATAQAQQCIDEVSMERLRSLSPGTLFNFLRLVSAMNRTFADPSLTEHVNTLLPRELRAALKDH